MQYLIKKNKLSSGGEDVVNNKEFNENEFLNNKVREPKDYFKIKNND